ncbi:MAG TPA: thioredoxin [Nitrosopumilaceae archaeon]|jgi:thioredoxin 1|nr:thioredoxin [Nitrosopumilaceae archaeon]
MENAKPVNTKSWQTEVMDSQVPVFVDFWAEWCGPCRMVSPVVEELSSEYPGKVKFVKVNVDESGELASKYNVFSIPTLAIFNKGEIIAQQVGAASKASYKNMIENALKKT